MRAPPSAYIIVTASSSTFTTLTFWYTLPSVVVQSSARTGTDIRTRSRIGNAFIFITLARVPRLINGSLLIRLGFLKGSFPGWKMGKGLHDIIAENGAGRMAFFFTKRLADFLQLIGAVFRLLPHILADEDGRFGLGGQDNAVAGPRVDLNDLRVDFVLRLEDDAGEIGVAAQRVDHDPLHLDVEGIEDVSDQFMRQGPLVMLPAHRHGDGTTHTRLDVNDKTFFVVADKNGQRVLIRGKDSKNLHAHDIRVHTLEIPLPAANDNDGRAFPNILNLFLIP